MEKYLKATEIMLPQSNNAKCPIYKHNGKYYIKANKPNTSVYNPFYHNNEEYSEVVKINGYWFTK